jgi:hypothetical protein
MTKVEAINELMRANDGIASWKYIYDNIEKYYPAAKVSPDWEAGIRGVLYRETKNTLKELDLAFSVSSNIKKKSM